MSLKYQFSKLRLSELDYQPQNTSCFKIISFSVFCSVLCDTARERYIFLN